MFHEEKDLEVIKNSLRIDHTEDDFIVKLALNSAIDYLKTAIGDGKPSFFVDNSKFDLATLMMTDHFYKNRSATFGTKFDGEIIETDRGITSIILQLKADYSYFKEVNEDAD